MALLAMTMLAVAFFARNAVKGLVHRFEAGDLRGAVEHSVVLIVLAFLICGNVVYQLAPGYVRRLAGHRPVAGDDLAAFTAHRLPSVLTLVPPTGRNATSWPRALLSAALQRYPGRVSCSSMAHRCEPASLAGQPPHGLRT